MKEDEKKLSIFIGEKIKTTRDTLSMSQEEAAERAGVSAIHLGRLERGERSMKLYTFLKLGKVLPFYELTFTDSSTKTLTPE